MRSSIGVLILVSTIAAGRCQTPALRPLVAFSSGNSVVLVSETGATVSTIRLPIRIGEFSLSPDLKSLVVVSWHPNDESGGKMYLYSLGSRQIRLIPAHAVMPESAKSEVYSEPEFSADGTRLFFNTHPQGEGDLAETNGPIAELDLRSLRARALETTMGLLTDGALMSPNGREILLWDEEKVIDTKGTTLYDIHDLQLDDSFHWALDMAWIGNSCVLYEAGKDSDHYSHSYLKDQISFFVLDLKSLKSTSASEVLGLSDKELDGLVSYRFPYAVVKSTPDSAGRGPGYFLISPGGKHTKLMSRDANMVEILLDETPEELPTECR